MCHVIILKVKLARNINHRYLNFLFELPNQTKYPKLALIYYQVSASLLLKKLFLLKTFIAKLITNLFKACFSTWKKKLLIVISCRCLD